MTSRHLVELTVVNFECFIIETAVISFSLSSHLQRTANFAKYVMSMYYFKNRKSYTIVIKI